MGVISSEEKLIMDRQAELETIDESLRPIQQLIWAREDEIAAAKKAKEIADKKFDLEIELLKLQGNEIEAIKRLREKELSALDSSLRPLQERIYRLEDEASANAKAAEIADKRQSLEIELLNLTGKSTEAVALQRKIELASLDDSLKPLQETRKMKFDLPINVTVEAYDEKHAEEIFNTFLSRATIS